MTPLVSQLVHGPVIAEHSDLAPGQGALGRPTWASGALLQNLELRLGLPRAEMDDTVRLQRWSRRLRTVCESRTCFYSSSYALDPIGTAKTLLEWRDALVLAGWDGNRIANGGERLDTLAELETSGSPTELASGFPDRLQRVTVELEGAGVRLFDALELAEERSVWPLLWQRAFVLLERYGTPVRAAPAPPFCANVDSDLGRVQALLRGERTTSPSPLVGDGSLLVLGAETSWELGQAAAALLRAWRPASAIVVRGGDVAALQAGFAAQGLPSQGLASTSQCRPALQVLPLALELAFEPRDPCRVLELLTLPEGPFQGPVGRELARALAEMPGMGGRPWLQAQQRLREAGVAEAQLERAAQWLEAPGHSGLSGAPREALLEATARVCDWLQAHLTAAHAALGASTADPSSARAVGVRGAALGQARAFREALCHDARAVLTLTEARQLLEETGGRGHALPLEAEDAGRIDAVAHPASLRHPRDVVLWWHCVSGTAWRPSPEPWRRAELAALSAAGVSFVATGERLAVEARAWHQVVLMARQRLVLAMPRSALGQALAPHPIWDEVVARLAAEAPDLARITVDARDWLAGDARSRPLRLDPAQSGVSDVTALPLPQPRLEWSIDPTQLGGTERHSASSLESLVGCPLKWVLRYRGGLHRGSVGALASGPMLNGRLGHRLVEELHLVGSLRDPDVTRATTPYQFDRLVRDEAAVLLRAGQASERDQLKKQLCRAIDSLTALFATSKLEVVGVEVQTEAVWRLGQLEGCIDLLLRDPAGREMVLDLKWGSSRYRQLLAEGAALQLAIYAALRRSVSVVATLPLAGYFSLGDGRLISTEVTPSSGGLETSIQGSDLSDTWQRLETTAELVQTLLARGRVLVTGLKRSLPIAKASESEGTRRQLELEPGSACSYCDYPALCGRSWEEFA
jgi:ATP-dependent helicase/nuclease subunit B